MTLGELIYKATTSMSKNRPQLKNNTHEFNMALAREMQRINAQSGNTVSNSDIAKFIQDSSAYDKVSENIGINKYTGRALLNEAKYQGFGAKPIVNAASEVFTLGLGPRWEYGTNENDKYLSDSMIKTRENLTAVGENALQMAIPTGAVKAVGVLNKATKLDKALRSSKVVLDKTLRSYKPTRKVLAAGYKAKRKINKPLGVTAKAVKSLVNGMLIDDYAKATLFTNPKGVADASMQIVRSMNPLKSTVPWYLTANAVFNWRGKDIHNYNQLVSGRLSDDQFIHLGIIPEEGRKAVTELGDKWYTKFGMTDEDVVDIARDDSTFTALENVSPAPQDTSKEVKQTSNTHKSTSPDKPWYHHAAVGYGTGGITGGATGYILSTLMGGDKATRIISTVGGSALGAVLGRIIQQRMLKS